MLVLIRIIQIIFRLIFFLPANIALAIMRAFAWILFAVVRLTPAKKMVIKNIKQIFPDSPAETIANKLIKNSAYGIFEIICMPFFKQKHIKKTVQVEGFDNIEAALNNKKGVILLTMHTGNYEACVMPLAQAGYKIHGIIRSTTEPLFKILNESRKATGISLINVLEEDMYKAALALLQKNEFIILLADTGALESRHEILNFLGHQVPVATGWLTLAQRSGCAVLPCVAFKAGPKNKLTIHPPMIIGPNNKQQTKADIIKIFEDFIKAHPEQWAMFWNKYETERMIKNK